MCTDQHVTHSYIWRWIKLKSSYRHVVAVIQPSGTIPQSQPKRKKWPRKTHQHGKPDSLLKPIRKTNQFQKLCRASSHSAPPPPLPSLLPSFQNGEERRKKAWKPKRLFTVNWFLELFYKFNKIQAPFPLLPVSDLWVKGERGVVFCVFHICIYMYW